LQLWQIRHIPNDRQTLLRLTFVASLCIVSAVMLWPETTSVSGQVAEGAKESSEGVGKASLATEFLEKVRQELPKHQSVKADLTQTVSIGDQQFRVTGEYLSSGQKLRLSYTVLPEQGAKGQMLEVCDGKELWTMITFPEAVRVTHRNIQQILAAAAAANQGSGSPPSTSVELGLGGVTALLASLERTMTFDVMKQVESNGRSMTVIQGRWKKEFIQRFPKDKDDALPPYVPDFVHVYVNSKTLFPEKLVYLKKQAQKKVSKLVSLEFHNVEFDGAVSDEVFTFKVPDGIVPEDVTKQYLDRMNAPAAQPGAATP
jgi:outer membrane lipoprotein-sorting protein